MYIYTYTHTLKKKSYLLKINEFNPNHAKNTYKYMNKLKFNVQNKQWNINRDNSINKLKYRIDRYPACVKQIYFSCLWMRVLFYFLFVCLHVCAYAFKFKVHCRCAFESGASRLHYFYTPPVCVPNVIGALAVCRQNNQKKMFQTECLTGGPESSKKNIRRFLFPICWFQFFQLQMQLEYYLCNYSNNCVTA